MRLVVEAHLESGQPVGSKSLASRADVEWGPSTVRAELATLEEGGLLAHPHTSAGRLPTEDGYRLYAGSLLARTERPPPRRGPALELSQMRREVDRAMRATTAALAQMTDLLALVTAPPLHTTTIHLVEVLRLQPQVVMVVVITSTGGVTKRVFAFERPVDPGLVEWAGTYLNERLAGMGLGARMLSGRLSDPELGPTEAGFLAEIAGALTELEQTAEDTLYVDGAARLFSEQRFQELPQIDALTRALERRATLLAMLRSALGERSVYLRIGAENPEPELRSVSLVAANYGLGYRNLGSVGVVGPLRMDYATAIAAVRDAAGELSRFVETVYEG